MNSAESKSKYGLNFYLVAIGIVTVCVLELIALFTWGKGGWLEKTSALLAVTGLYGLALGFFSKSEALAPIKAVLTDLTSPNPIRYLSANASFSGLIALIGARGTKKEMSTDCPDNTLWFLGLFLWIPIAIVFFVYTLLHFFVIAPLTYIPMVIVSAITTKINCSAGDDIVRIGDQKISIKSLIKGDIVAVKGFIIGVPSITISFLSQVFLIIT